MGRALSDAATLPPAVESASHSLAASVGYLLAGRRLERSRRFRGTLMVLHMPLLLSGWLALLCACDTALMQLAGGFDQKEIVERHGPCCIPAGGALSW